MVVMLEAYGCESLYVGCRWSHSWTYSERPCTPPASVAFISRSAAVSCCLDRRSCTTRRRRTKCSRHGNAPVSSANSLPVQVHTAKARVAACSHIAVRKSLGPFSGRLLDSGSTLFTLVSSSSLYTSMQRSHNSWAPCRAWSHSSRASIRCVAAKAWL